ncbi:MAG: hypothetical protein A2Y33_15330 [Spirochaetes bacterium GWF1_51_8]|nr:MAG: hypothetical protein A2Y33_15330 [Spirochaetes bacterium GWF1_51_8]
MEESAGFIGEIKSGNIRINVNKFGSSMYLDIRKYFTNAENQLSPTKKGISLNKEQFLEVLEFLSAKKDEIIKLL